MPQLEFQICDGFASLPKKQLQQNGKLIPVNRVHLCRAEGRSRKMFCLSRFAGYKEGFPLREAFLSLTRVWMLFLHRPLHGSAFRGLDAEGVDAGGEGGNVEVVVGGGGG